jgi:hypothetical protein
MFTFNRYIGIIINGYTYLSTETSLLLINIYISSIDIMVVILILETIKINQVFFYYYVSYSPVLVIVSIKLVTFLYKKITCGYFSPYFHDIITSKGLRSLDIIVL